MSAPSPKPAPTLRERAEVVFRLNAALSMEQLSDLSPQAAQAMLHELSVHQIELEMQNEELRDTQAARDAALERYMDLYDHSPAGYVTVTEKGLISQVNLTAVMMLGASRETLLRNPFTRCLVAGDQDTFYLMRKKLISDRSAQSCDVRLATSDGALVWVNLSATGAEDENGAPTMRIVMSDITERIYLRDALHLSLREKESMLGVIHQRVSSNLQVIDSMLRLEERRTEQSETQSVLADLQKRIRSIALVHRTLHRTGMFTNLDLGAYLKKLATESFSYPANVQLRLNLASLHLNMDQVVAAGLIVNELLNNCLAHAFPEGRAGEIAIELQPVDQTDHWRLCVSDTGAGLPEHFQPAKNPLGLQLVADLAMQLGGKLEIGPRPAAIFNIIFSARTGNS